VHNCIVIDIARSPSWHLYWTKTKLIIQREEHFEYHCTVLFLRATIALSAIVARQSTRQFTKGIRTIKMCKLYSNDARW